MTRDAQRVQTSAKADAMARLTLLFNQRLTQAKVIDPRRTARNSTSHSWCNLTRRIRRRCWLGRRWRVERWTKQKPRFAVRILLERAAGSPRHMLQALMMQASAPFDMT